MFRRLSIPFALACVMFLVQAAVADVGRSGGIVILPCGLPMIGCPHDIVRSSFELAGGTDLHFQLPSNLGSQVLAVVGLDEGGPGVEGRIENGVLTFRNAELGALRRAGVRGFGVMIVDSQQVGLFLDFSMVKDDTVIVRAR